MGGRLFIFGRITKQFLRKWRPVDFAERGDARGNREEICEFIDNNMDARRTGCGVV
jgi:hypothetical protein